MTVKELSEILDLNKRTVTNKLKKLKIEPHIKGNKFVLSDEEVEMLIKSFYPNDFSEYLRKASIARKTDDIENEVKNIENIKENNENNIENTTNTEKHNEQNESKTANSANDPSEKLIQMLEKALEDKESTIKAQQNQIDMLIKSNAMLMQRLEDKQQPKTDIVVNAEDPKRPWWKRFFSSSQEKEETA